MVEAGAGVLKVGTVLGRIRDTGVCRRFNPAASDGTQIACAIVDEEAVVDDADRCCHAILSGADFPVADLVFMDHVTLEQRSDAIAQLKARPCEIDLK